MTAVGTHFVGQEDQVFQSLGEAVQTVIRRRWRSNAAKMLEQQWDLDPRTAKNVVQTGNVSERTLNKAIRAEGWSLLAELGEALTGQSYEDHLASLIEDTRRAQEHLARRRDHVRDLEARAASVVASWDRLDA